MWGTSFYDILDTERRDGHKAGGPHCLHCWPTIQVYYVNIHLFVCVSIYLFIYLSTRPSIYLYIHYLSFFYLFSMYVFFLLSNLSFYLSINFNMTIHNKSMSFLSKSCISQEDRICCCYRCCWCHSRWRPSSSGRCRVQGEKCRAQVGEACNLPQQDFLVGLFKPIKVHK